MASSVSKLAPAIVVPPLKPLGWTGPREPSEKRKKVGAIRALKKDDPHLTMYDAMLMAFENLGPSETNPARDYAFNQGLMARVPKRKTIKAGGLYSHSDRLFPAAVARLYFDYHLIDEVAPTGRDLMHKINDKGIAFLRNRLEKYVPDSDLEAIQLHMNLGRAPQKAPPKDYSALDPVRKRLDEAKVRAAFEAALDKAVAMPAQDETASHFVYISENGGIETPYIYRTDKYRSVIRFSEEAHPYHAIYQEFVVKARAHSFSLRVTIDYDGGVQGKPFAVEFKVTRQKVALVVTKPSSPPRKGIHKNPKVSHDTKQEPTKTSEAVVRARPDLSRQIVMPIAPVPYFGEVKLADAVRIIDAEKARVGKPAFHQREARLLERFGLAREQLTLYVKRKVPENDPVPCAIDIPSVDLANPHNPYHYVVEEFYTWADQNDFVVVVDQISNGLSVLFTPKPKLLSA